MRTITLELLRHGPPRNQLLSPLTQYLALCENHAATTLQVPFEHNQFLHRLLALGYRQDEESRAFQLKDTAQELGKVLGHVPGLIAELNREQPAKVRNGNGARSPEHMTHLRLVISASELALLPLELALAPDGCPGAGQYLLLQSQEPICLTREVRRVPEQVMRWPSKPKILLAAAAPPQTGPIPLEAHVQVLREAIEPWVGPYVSTEERRRRIAEHLVVLPQATAASLQEACATGGFTHVHILAHGVQYMEGYDVRYGLAFHDERDPDGPADVVTGTRLATIIRASQHHDHEGLARPAAVTLASCNSGNVGTVGGMGASVAHALHEAGIPLVTAGQFPLSFEGSVCLTDILYNGLLWGDDPRIVLDDLRRRLHSEFPSRHDWAALTTYASFPPQLDRDLLDVRISQAMRAVNVAMSHADFATARAPSSRSTRARSSASDTDRKDLLARAKEKIENAKLRLERVASRAPGQRARLWGLLASTEKRRAEVYFRFSAMDERSRAAYSSAAFEGLRASRKHYWRTFELDRGSSWALVQHLSLAILLQNGPEQYRELTVETDPAHRSFDAQWLLATALSLEDIGSRKVQRAVWALGNLLELAVLRPVALAEPVGAVPGAVPELVPAALAADLVKRAGADSFEVYSTRRQILRYVEWFPDMFPGVQQVTALANSAEPILSLLPEAVERDWRS